MFVELAQRVGVSRASLARRFTAVVGEAPMSYLTGWRITLAADANWCLVVVSDALGEPSWCELDGPMAVSYAEPALSGSHPRRSLRRLTHAQVTSDAPD